MALADRRKRNAALTRPELSVLLAYAKLSLYSELLADSVPDDPYLSRGLERYFPKEMSQRYDDALHRRRLRREIIATQLTNSMINRGGATLIVRISDQTGALPAAIAAAFAAVRQSYDMVALNGEIDGLDNKMSGRAQHIDLYAMVQDLLLDRLVWFLRNVDLKQGLEKIVAHYREGISQVAATLDGALSKTAMSARDARLVELAKAGVPDDLARQLASLPLLKAAPDIVLVADRAKKPVGEVTATYFATEAFFHSTASPTRCPASWCRIISTGWRSTARSIRSAMPSGGSPLPWSIMATPAPARWTNGSNRARPRSNAFDQRSTKSPARG